MVNNSYSVGKEIIVPDMEPRAGFKELKLTTSGGDCAADREKQAGIILIITILDLESFN